MMLTGAQRAVIHGICDSITNDPTFDFQLVSFATGGTREDTKRRRLDIKRLPKRAGGAPPVGDQGTGAAQA